MGVDSCTFSSSIRPRGIKICFSLWGSIPPLRSKLSRHVFSIIADERFLPVMRECVADRHGSWLSPFVCPPFLVDTGKSFFFRDESQKSPGASPVVSLEVTTLSSPTSLFSPFASFFKPSVLIDDRSLLSLPLTGHAGFRKTIPTESVGIAVSQEYPFPRLNTLNVPSPSLSSEFEGVPLVFPFPFASSSIPKYYSRGGWSNPPPLS